MSPTNPPTSVPLILMNCRSRPTCTSIFSDAAVASYPSTVRAISAETSGRYCSTTPVTSRSTA